MAIGLTNWFKKTFLGYEEKTINEVVVDKAGDEETVNIILNEGGKVLSDVSVKTTARTATAKGETVNALITFQKNMWKLIWMVKLMMKSLKETQQKILS